MCVSVSRFAGGSADLNQPDTQQKHTLWLLESFQHGSEKQTCCVYCKKPQFKLFFCRKCKLQGYKDITYFRAERGGQCAVLLLYVEVTTSPRMLGKGSIDLSKEGGEFWTFVNSFKNNHSCNKVP